MKKIYTLLFFIALAHYQAKAQDTFYITVVDTASGFLGSAGASCIPNSIIISDIVEGYGVIHTQSFYLQGNQSNARSYFEQGYSPKEILWLTNMNDVQQDSTRRQYGITSLKGETAAYTGDSCLNFHKHITGKIGTIFYTMQGNILLKESVIDSMEAYFLRAKGGIDDRMMAGLQGANFPGADSRCLDTANGLKKPAISSFIRMAKPGDGGSYELDLRVRNTQASQNPIDSLQKLYNVYKQQTGITNGKINRERLIAYPNPANNTITVQLALIQNIALYNTNGTLVASSTNHNITVEELPAGLYFLRATNNKGVYTQKVQIQH